MVLTRDAIKNGFIDRMIDERGGYPGRWTEEQIVACYRGMLATAPPGDVWIFGYGSLIWNPCIHVAEMRRALLRGYHRRFCLWTHLGRGSPDCPGLMLGLMPGGSCNGVALRVERDVAEAEFDILFRREMVSGSYDPRWVAVEVDGMDEPVKALCFLMNRAHDRYAGRLTDAVQADAIARAVGPLGACRDYLDQTVAALTALGIHDRSLGRLQKMVHERLAPAG
ncbi:MAG: gamma-glutamylcyclotransferase [Rhodospirillaceae bacterium]|nr:gamma-glutamylcyclotransferase [Rhodospirillaceae bacterium]